MPILLATRNISKNITVCRCCLSSSCEKCSARSTQLWSSILVKKDPATNHALKTKLSFKSFGKYLRKLVCVGIQLLQNFSTQPTTCIFVVKFSLKVYIQCKILVNTESVEGVLLKTFPYVDNSWMHRPEFYENCVIYVCLNADAEISKWSHFNVGICSSYHDLKFPRIWFE